MYVLEQKFVSVCNCFIAQPSQYCEPVFVHVGLVLQQTLNSPLIKEAGQVEQLTNRATMYSLNRRMYQKLIRCGLFKALALLFQTHYQNQNPQNSFGNINDLGACRSRPEAYFIFQQNSPTQLASFQDMVLNKVQNNTVLYDKTGEQHYDIISAFIKSIRGSDPNAAVYWLARMIEGGEDVKFIARRLLIAASEDIGNANPTALILANNTFQAVSVIGNPESRIILSQCAVYLANSPKSNASYIAINKAIGLVQSTGDLSIPLHLRNAPTKLMQDLDYGKNYKYAHNYENNFVPQEFLPKEIENTKFYEPSNNSRENDFRNKLKARWQDKYKY